MGEHQRLAGKVAIVTGAGSKPSETGAYGTGKAIAVLFARQGASVILVDRHEDRANETRHVIEDEGGTAAVLTANLAHAADCDQLIAEAAAAFGRIDILINNAAAFFLKGLLETTPEDYDVSVATNLTVPFMLCRAAIPVMAETGGGAIVNISSTAAVRGGGVPAYAVSKAGMQALTMSVACEFGPLGIRANSVIVGAVDTPLRRHSTQSVGYTVTNSPLPTEGDAWDIAEAALYLASPAAKHVTGVQLAVDGGATVMSSSASFAQLRAVTGGSTRASTAT